MKVKRKPKIPEPRPMFAVGQTVWLVRRKRVHETTVKRVRISIVDNLYEVRYYLFGFWRSVSETDLINPASFWKRQTALRKIGGIS